MQLSMRLWTILAFNGLVLAVSLYQGWIAQDVAGQLVEERVAKEMTASVSTFLAGKSFPLSNAMMGYLREILSEDWVAVRGDYSEILGSSLSEPLTQDFRQKIRDIGPTGSIKLGDAHYRVDSNEVADNKHSSGDFGTTSGPTRLYVLIPSAKLAEARSRASRRVAAAIVPSTILATALAMFLAFGITHPVRKLTREMDRLAATPPDQTAPMTEGAFDDQGHFASVTSDQRALLLSKGPKEARQLAASFYGLLDRLAVARQQLMQSDRLATLGTICLSVAHELRNPLSGIKMNVRVLQDRISPADDPGVEAILREIDRMGLYLDELMSFAPGIRRTDKPPSHTPAKLSALADGVLTILAGRCRHAKVEVKKSYPTPEPLVFGDSNQIRQAMMNFVVNALEAMPSGGTLTVSVRPAVSAVGFFVADTGAGVQAQDTDIFDAFSTDKPNGSGLGLYLAKQVVLRHGGRIGYDNSVQGAVFWFELPNAPALLESPLRDEA